MAWVVDTCVVIDILEADPEFGMRSANQLEFVPHRKSRREAFLFAELGIDELGFRASLLVFRLLIY